MLSVSPDCRTRSSLEEMLDSLRRSDETDGVKDRPPTLPVRPRSTPRARLPSAKRPLPMSEENGGSERLLPVKSSLNCGEKKVRMKGRGGFGVKKVRAVEVGESPYLIVETDGKDSVRFREVECDDNVEYFSRKKLRVWCQLHDGHWKSGEIKSTSGEKAVVLFPDDSVITFPKEELLPANPVILDGVDDLVQLGYVNEPSVLHNLQYRYSRDMLYTKAGPVLVAVNPFKDIPLHNSEFITAYKHKLLDMPHVYAIVGAAYDEMMADAGSQSIIISGESGAGKTEIAKIALKYLSALGGGGDAIDTRILQASCILEAFGNAKTARSNNSSRFGKLTEIHFNAIGQICGAKIQTFFLDKSRVAQLAQGERSYHIFYHLCSGAPDDLRGRLMLKRASDYNYLNQNGCSEIDKTDDAQKFCMLREALCTLGICKEDQEHAFELLAAVLWLGNISFLVTDNQNHAEVVVDEAVTNTASLMGCKEQDLMLALSTRKIQVGKDEVTRRLTQQQAIDTRDAMAKFIYASLFDWLVQEINSSLSTGEHNAERSISILDIYGFESFEKNSFEQLCINYANERLQHHLNRHLFKLKQEEYELDGVDCTKVDFEDNQECLDLFEKKIDGLISLLDEVSTLPKATDVTFFTKLKQRLNGNKCFKVERDGVFSVRHYSGEVVYDTQNFLEKNRDLMHPKTIKLLMACTGRLPRQFASSLMEQLQDPEHASMQLGMLACRKQSVATKFKVQLFKLMLHLESTKPHFICCVKPNKNQIPGVFEKDLVLEQLRCSRVLEVVRMSKSGYPISMTHEEFSGRYAFLLPEDMACQDPLNKSVAIMQRFGIPPEMYQVGYRKLYFRIRQIYELEAARKQEAQQCSTPEMQKHIRRSHRCACRDFHALNGVVATLQSYIRGEISRKMFRALYQSKKQVVREKQQHMAVVQIQSAIRGWLARRHFGHIRNSQLENSSKLKPGWISKVQDQAPGTLHTVIEELQRQVLTAETTIEQKEKENTDLQEQLQHGRIRWLEYETRMKSMEEVWQRQITSLQMSLAAAKRGHPIDNTVGRINGAQSPIFYDSEDMSIGAQTPGCSTPMRSINNGLEGVPFPHMNGGLNHPVNTLLKEFERETQELDDQARAIIDVKSGNSLSTNLIDELRRLKHRFETWKKEYKIRLKDAKVKVYKLGNAEAEKYRRTWWGKRNKR